MLTDLSGSFKLAPESVEKFWKTAANLASNRKRGNVTRAQFAVSILTLRWDYLKLILKSIGLSSIADLRLQIAGLNLGLTSRSS